MASMSQRVSPRGTVTYRVTFRLNGAQKQVSFVHPEGQREFHDLIEQIGPEAAMRVLEARTVRPEDMPTLAAYTERYLDPASGLLTGIQDGTRRSYQRNAERSFLRILGAMPVNAITRSDIGRWLTWQEKQQAVTTARDKSVTRTVSAKTIRNHHALLSGVLKSAVEHGLREDNPAYRMRLREGVREEPVFLSSAEFATLLSFTPQPFQALVYFLVSTGVRWGEATALTWSDLVLHGKTPSVRVTKAWKKTAGGPAEIGTTKSRKGRRTVSLSPDCVRLLGHPGAPTDFVFTGLEGTGHLWHGVFNRHWQKAVGQATNRAACAELGLRPIPRAPRIHDLRHTHASWLIAAGMPLPYVQARLGHEKITTTVDTYGHLVPDAHEMMATAVTDTLATAIQVSTDDTAPMTIVLRESMPANESTRRLVSAPTRAVVSQP